MKLYCDISGIYAKRVYVTEPEESDYPDKRQRDGIGGEASVTVDNKPLSALPDAVSASGSDRHQATTEGQRCRLSEYIMTIVDYLVIFTLYK